MRANFVCVMLLFNGEELVEYNPPSQPMLQDVWLEHPNMQMMAARDQEGIANGPIFICYKIPEFFEKSPLPKAEKHHIYQVTLCLQNDTTNTNCAYIESE